VITLINAHRGDPIQFRENTMPAFASAVKLGADCIELDIRSSLDGRAVVLHDATLERLWGFNQPVAALTYDRIFEMTKDSELYVPRLEEVLSSFDVPVMVDFVDETAVQPIIRALAEQRAAGRCIISSGNIPALMTIRRNIKDVAIALTWNDIVPPSNALLKELDVQYFNPNYQLYQDDFIREHLLHHHETSTHSHMVQGSLERQREHPDWYQQDALCGAHLVQYMHDAGLKTSAWTVDESAIMVEMIKLGIDLLTTNDIRMLMEVRNGQ
jgi:glycerophosphoryl diester phosphodiesterase